MALSARLLMPAIQGNLDCILFLKPIHLPYYLSFQHQVFSLPVLEHLEGLQSADNVHWVHRRLLADLCAVGKGKE